MMNARTRLFTTLAAFALIFCLVNLGSASAQSTNHCMKVKGTFLDVGAGFTTTTTITNGGVLNGTGETVYSPDFAFTTDPTTVSFTADTTLTTNRGVLRTHNVYILDFAIFWGTALYRIDPNTSTGIFAGATGVLFINAKSTDGGFTVEGDIGGEICFAN